jgi:ribosome-associated protein
MDYLDLVIHIFSRNARAFYDLERLWRDAKRIDAGPMIVKKDVRPGRRKTMKSP